MRCKCCDAIDASFKQGDYYCSECLSAINEAVTELREQDIIFEQLFPTGVKVTLKEE